MTKPAPFEGVIARTVKDSTPSWPVPAHPREGAPNVVVVLIDDLGFSHFGCYGSDIATPWIDRLAEGGLRSACDRSPTSTPGSPTCAGR